MLEIFVEYILPQMSSVELYSAGGPSLLTTARAAAENFSVSHQLAFDILQLFSTNSQHCLNHR